MTDIDNIDSLDHLDRLIEDILSNPRAVEPSPQFTARVMWAVQREAELPPLAFPLKRFAFAALFLLVVIGAGVLQQ